MENPVKVSASKATDRGSREDEGPVLKLLTNKIRNIKKKQNKMKEKEAKERGPPATTFEESPATFEDLQREINLLDSIKQSIKALPVEKLKLEEKMEVHEAANKGKAATIESSSPKQAANKGKAASTKSGRPKQLQAANTEKATTTEYGSPKQSFATVVTGEPRYGLMAYSIFADGQHGLTSKNAIVSDDLRCEIGIFNFGSPEEAKTMARRLEFCKGEHVLQLIFVDNSRVVTERFDHSISNYFQEKFKLFEVRKERQTSWWQYILSDFKRIFKDVAAGLKQILSKSHPHGNLQNGIVLCHGNAKLTNIVKDRVTNQEFQKHAVADILELRRVMVGILQMGYKGHDFSKTVPKDVQEDLEIFLHSIANKDELMKLDPCWVLNDAFFWTPLKRVTFAFLLRTVLVFERYRLISYEDEGPLESFDKFFENLPDGPLNSVSSHTDTQRDDLASPADYFLRIVSFYRNCHVHLHNHMKRDGSYMDEISADKEVHQKIGAVCSKIRKAFGKYTSRSHYRTYRTENIDFLIKEF